MGRDAGRIRASGLCGAFKVPTLRNVAVTAPYGHNGSLATLRDVARFYVTRGPDPSLWYAGSMRPDDLPSSDLQNVNATEVPHDRRPGEAPRLTDAEIDAVVAFLQTLTDGTGTSPDSMAETLSRELRCFRKPSRMVRVMAWAVHRHRAFR